MAELTGFTLYAVDRPGSGLNEAFDYRGVDLRTHAVSFLDSVLRELRLDRVPIVANSMGGLWAFWLALDVPDRVMALAQLGCPALMLGTSAPLAMRFLSLGVLKRGSPRRPGQADKTLTHVTGPNTVSRMPSALVDAMYEAEVSEAHMQTRLSMIREALRLRGPNPEKELGPDELAKVEQPVVFVWGEDDWYGPPDVGERACAVMPDAVMLRLPAGHLPWLDEPSACARAVLELVTQRVHLAP